MTDDPLPDDRRPHRRRRRGVRRIDVVPVGLLRVLAALLDDAANAHRLLVRVQVAHDDDCDLWAGLPCSCDPDVSVVTRDESAPGDPHTRGGPR